MIEIDGSLGEGGGQILRTSLCLSLLTQTPVHFYNIRAKRKKPGLKNQHLTCVKAAQEIGCAEVKGAELHSQEIYFSPQSLQGGHYVFSMAGAGSTMLVLQTILPALALAPQPSYLQLEGGTHNPMSPHYDYIKEVFLPLFCQMGPQIESTLKRPGFFPVGAGQATIKITPCTQLQALHLPTELNIGSIKADVLQARLPAHIFQREEKLIRAQLPECHRIELKEYPQSKGSGHVLMLKAIDKNTQVLEIVTGFGMKGLSAERLVQSAIKEFNGYLKDKVRVGEYLADQLLLPMALAGSGSFMTSKPSLHTLTNIETIQRFIDIKIRVSEGPKGWMIQVGAPLLS